MRDDGRIEKIRSVKKELFLKFQHYNLLVYSFSFFNSEGGCSTSSAAVDPVKERKYLVTASQLLLLFSVCIKCLAPTRTKLTHRGTLVHAVITCARGHKTVWENQPRINSKALLNILLPAAITYSGASPTRVLRLLGSIGVQVLKKTQFFRVQSSLVFPAATKVSRSDYKIVRSLNMFTD